MTKRKADANINIRTTTPLKRLVEARAKRRGLSMTAHVTSTLVEDAQQGLPERKVRQILEGE